MFKLGQRPLCKQAVTLLHRRIAVKERRQLRLQKLNDCFAYSRLSAHGSPHK